MELTVSIASHGQNAMLAPLLEQLHALSETVPMCVIVTENIPDQQIHYPTSDTFVVRWNGNIRPKGFGANHNAAFAMCGTPYFLVLNPDIRLAADANLHALIHCVRQSPGAAGPIVLSPQGSVEDSARRVPTIVRLFARYFLNRRPLEYPRPEGNNRVDWLAGMCMMFDRHSFADVEGFDERYHMYCEDVDICLRLHLKGWHVSWVGEAQVVHDAQRQSRRDRQYLKWHMNSIGRLMLSSAYWRYRLFKANRNV